MPRHQLRYLDDRIARLEKPVTVRVHVTEGVRFVITPIQWRIIIEHTMRALFFILCAAGAIHFEREATNAGYVFGAVTPVTVFSALEARTIVPVNHGACRPILVAS